MDSFTTAIIECASAIRKKKHFQKNVKRFRDGNAKKNTMKRHNRHRDGIPKKQPNRVGMNDTAVP